MSLQQHHLDMDCQPLWSPSLDLLGRHNTPASITKREQRLQASLSASNPSHNLLDLVGEKRKTSPPSFQATWDLNHHYWQANQKSSSELLTCKLQSFFTNDSTMVPPIVMKNGGNEKDATDHRSPPFHPHLLTLGPVWALVPLICVTEI